MKKRNNKILTAMLALSLSMLLLLVGCVEGDIIKELAKDIEVNINSKTHNTGDEKPIDLPSDSNIVRIQIDRSPADLVVGDYPYRVYKSTDKIKSIMDYLFSLEFTSAFSDSPDEYSGSSYTITTTDSDGKVCRYMHFGEFFAQYTENMEISWKRMDKIQARELDVLLSMNESDIEPPIDDSDMSVYTKAAKRAVYRTYGIEEDCLSVGNVLVAPGSTPLDPVVSVELSIVYAGKYKTREDLTVTVSGIALNAKITDKSYNAEQYAAFAPYAGDAAFDIALARMGEIPEQSSGLYFEIDKEGYLCACYEQIQNIDYSPNTDEFGITESGCGIDHIHVFKRERVCRVPDTQIKE